MVTEILKVMDTILKKRSNLFDIYFAISTFCTHFFALMHKKRNEDDIF